MEPNITIVRFYFIPLFLSTVEHVEHCQCLLIVTCNFIPIPFYYIHTVLLYNIFFNNAYMHSLKVCQEKIILTDRDEAEKNIAGDDYLINVCDYI